MSRKEEERGLASIQDSVDASIQRLEDYIKKRRKTDFSHQKQYRQHKHQQYKNNQEIKVRRKITVMISKIPYEKTWTGLRKGNIRRETKSLLIATQSYAIMTMSKQE